MKRISIVAAALAVMAGAMAQQRQPDTASMASGVSGQFLVSARGTMLSAHSKELAAETNRVVLQPALTAVSCERIKEELLRLLGIQDQWKGRIFVILRPAQSADDIPEVVAEKFGANWNCRVRLPDVIDRNRFAEAVVHAVLLEIANRNAASRSAEIPEWMSKGFARQLISSAGEELVLAPPDEKQNGFSVKRIRVDLTDNPTVSGPNTRRFNPLAEAIATLHVKAPLTYDDLSWPTKEQLSGGDQDVYNSSAQVFVTQLLRLKDGPAAMRTMLSKLPDYLNWQLAFMDAYETDFQTSLDVEKWWSVELVQFGGRDVFHLWTDEESWRQMDAFFRIPIDVQIGPGAPMRTDIKFQTIILGWSRVEQLAFLRKKLWDLDLIRQQVSPEFMPLVDDYRRVLQNYYKQRTELGQAAPKNTPVVEKVVEDTAEQLDALDESRAAMRPHAQVPVASVEGTAHEGATQ